MAMSSQIENPSWPYCFSGGSRNTVPTKKKKRHFITRQLSTIIGVFPRCDSRRHLRSNRMAHADNDNFAASQAVLCIITSNPNGQWRPWAAAGWCGLCKDQSLQNSWSSWESTWNWSVDATWCTTSWSRMTGHRRYLTRFFLILSFTGMVTKTGSLGNVRPNW